MNSPRIEIKTDGACNTQIYVDGMRLKGVRSFELKQTANGAPVLTVDLNGFDLSADAPMVVMQKGFEQPIDFYDGKIAESVYAAVQSQQHSELSKKNNATITNGTALLL